MHDKLTKKLFSASISQFFEVITIGNILTRYSEDTTRCDTDIPNSISPMFLILNLMLGILIIAMYVTWGWVLPLILIYLYYVYRLSKLFFKPNDFVKRLQMKHESKLASFFLESIHGLTVIRSFGKTADFTKIYFKKI